MSYTIPKRRPSREDVAKLAGVSDATVSNVLNRPLNTVPIAPETRKRVLEAARKVGYLRNRVAASLVLHRTQTAGVIVRTLKGSFHSTLLEGVHKQLVARDYHCMLMFANGGDETLQQTHMLMERCVDGLIIVGDCLPQQTAAWLKFAQRKCTPVVLVDLKVAGNVDMVISDDYSGAFEATEHLLRLGHRRIAHIEGDPRMFTAQNRKAGYIAALREAGLAPAKELILGGKWSSPEVQAQVARMLGSHPHPTAVFAASDALASAVLMSASERGLRVPADLAVIGFGDTETSLNMGLTTVSQSATTMGAWAADRLLERILHPQLKTETLVLPTELIVRRSCGDRDFSQNVLFSGEFDKTASVYHRACP
ncbi:MAG: LacI family DNA-binding transcriptional regulator [Verrucomicrobiae bacterium]|nr:LacI family DNA-binding transcriptional regulator [Verrucomicrobiae bacterium]